MSYLLPVAVISCVAQLAVQLGDLPDMSSANLQRPELFY